MLGGARVAPACVGLEARVGARQQLSQANRLLDGVADTLGGGGMLEVAGVADEGPPRAVGVRKKPRINDSGATMRSLTISALSRAPGSIV